MQYDQRMMHKIQPIYLILYDMAQAIGGFATDTPCAAAYRPSGDTARLGFAMCSLCGLGAYAKRFICSLETMRAFPDWTDHD